MPLAPSCSWSSPVPPSIFHHKTAGGGYVDPPGLKPTKNFTFKSSRALLLVAIERAKDGSPHLPVFLNLLLRLRCRALSFLLCSFPHNLDHKHGHDKDPPTRVQLWQYTTTAPPPQTPTQKCPRTPPPLSQRPPPQPRPPRPSSWERSKSSPPPPPPPTPLEISPASGSRNPPSQSQARSCLGCRRSSSRGAGRQPPNSAKRPREERSSSPRRGRARLGSRRGLMGCCLGGVGKAWNLMGRGAWVR